VYKLLKPVMYKDMPESHGAICGLQAVRRVKYTTSSLQIHTTAT